MGRAQGEDAVRRIANLHRFQLQPEPALPADPAEVAALLRRARAKVVEGWAPTTAWALTGDGKWSLPDGPGAQVWSPVGALLAVVFSHQGRFTFAEALRTLNVLVRPEPSVDSWNAMPGRTKEEVLELFDMAIAAIEIESAPC